MAVRYFSDTNRQRRPPKKRDRLEGYDDAANRQRSFSTGNKVTKLPVNNPRIGFTPGGDTDSSGRTTTRPTGDGGSDAGSAGTTGAGTGYEAQTRFGKSVLPGMYGEAESNPDALIRLWFQQQGIGTHGGSYGAALDQADSLKLLWLLMSGKESLKGTPHFLDWTGGQLQNLFTPGGDVITPHEIFAAMQTGDKNNPVYNYLNNPDMLPSDQVQNIGSTLNTSMKGVMPDIVRAAMLARVRELGDNFQALRLQKTGSTPFLNYMTGQGFNI